MRTPVPKDDGNKRRQYFVQITPKTARILLKILELESQGATIKLLAESLRMSRSDVWNFIKQAEMDSRQFLDFNEDWSSTKGRKISAKKGSVPGTKNSRGGGRHTDLLEIRPDKLVTNPLSAKILLMLAFASTSDREVYKPAFLESLLLELDYLKPRYRNLKKELAARLDFLTKIGDICTGENTVPDIIWISWLRYHSQRPYLELLVEERLPQPPSS